MSYKVPLGIALVILMGVLSLRRTPPTWAEAGLIVPWVAWTALMLTARINIGFRHFLPAYVFLLMLSSRCLAAPGRWRAALAWAGVAAAALHAATFHPDYLTYINAPRGKPYLAISDSNIDWGQSLKQVAAWLDEHPQPGRTVYLCYFGSDYGTMAHYLDGRVVRLGRGDVPEEKGLLITSPIFLVSDERFAALWPMDPDAVIGHAMLVFDLARFGGELPFRATPQQDEPAEPGLSGTGGIGRRSGRRRSAGPRRGCRP